MGTLRKKKTFSGQDVSIEENDSDKVVPGLPKVRTKRTSANRKTSKEKLTVEEDESDKLLPKMRRKNTNTASKRTEKLAAGEDPDLKTNDETVEMDMNTVTKKLAPSVMSSVATATEHSESELSNFRRFFAEEAHPFMLANLNTLTKEEAVQLDDYLKLKSSFHANDNLYTSTDKYIIHRKLAEGRFSAIYLAESTKIGFVAIKTELRKLQFSTRLRAEVRALAKFEAAKEHKSKRIHFPRLIDSGRGSGVIFLVLNLLGDNLNKIKAECGGRFTKPTALFLIFESLKAIRDIHFFGLAHRDVKPSNFCMSTDRKRLYIVDFGSSRKIDKRASGTGKQRASLLNGIINDEESLTYASIEVHKNETTSPKCDLESWFYMICELMLPARLPWRYIKFESKVVAMKEEFYKTFGGEMVRTIGAPFREILEYIQGVRPDSTVDYSKLKEMVRRSIHQETNGGTNLRLDWERD